jgi:hypothetical protein
MLVPKSKKMNVLKDQSDKLIRDLNNFLFVHEEEGEIY